MHFIRAGEYVINLELITSCRLRSDGGIQLTLSGQDGHIILTGAEADIIRKAVNA